jgi:acetoin utilization deacetylase AcuC-like enzyme
MERLRRSGITHEMQQVQAQEIDPDELGHVHPTPFIQRIKDSEPAEGTSRVDPDTYMSPGSMRAALLAAGACVQATELVLSGAVSNAFCAVRPPGHHAELAEAMGFCLFNNIAAGALHALSEDGIERVAILDFDVHHCNGTVDIFKNDERVLVCSSFQDHFYPHRYLDFTNEHIISTPLEAGTPSRDFRRRIEQDWLPAIDVHKPDFFFISAGFDAHRDDPIGELLLNEDDFNWATSLIAAKAWEYGHGRIVSTLEGGYDLEALAASALAHVEALIDATSSRA